MLGSTSKQTLSLEAGVQFENLTKENEELKYKIGILERENKNLKKSVFQLSHTTSQQAAQIKSLLRQGSTLERYGEVEVNGLSSSSTDGYNSGVAVREGMFDSKEALRDSLGGLSISKPISDNTNANGAEESLKPTLYCEAALTGHQGAVYAVEWSPNGKLLASGSFDKTVRLWATTSLASMEPLQVGCRIGHSQLVSSLAWTGDGTSLISGSFDHSVRIWDVERLGAASDQASPLGSQSDGDGASLASEGDRKPQVRPAVNSWKARGFVQSVCVARNTRNISVFCGTSKGFIHHFDVRESDTAGSCWSNVNGAMVNTVQVSTEGKTLVTGDAAGCVRVWDLRSYGKPVVSSSIQNGTNEKPITHLAFSQPLNANGLPRLSVAVNSYDNLLRVYTWNDLKSNAPLSSEKFKTFKGHQNKHWPIKSSFYCEKRIRKDNISDPPLVLLASGSATSSCYVYDVNQGGLYQKLIGHKGRVYSCSFRPLVPGSEHFSTTELAEDPFGGDLCLATCSADSTVRLWCPQLSDEGST